MSKELLAVGLAAMLTVCGALAAHAAPPAIGQIKGLEGDVHIESPQGRRAAELGGDVYQSDTLVTGTDSSIGITFRDDTRFSAGPNSRVALERFAYDPTTHEGAFESNVERGTLAVTSGKLAKTSGDAMKVKLRGRILGVRGTKFFVRAAE